MTDGQSTGVFVTSRGTLGLGKSTHKSRSASLAAELNAPYRQTPTRVWVATAAGIILSLTILLADGGFFLFLLAVLGTFGAAIYFSAPTDGEAAEERRWRGQWYCKKYGEIFFETGMGAQFSERPTSSSSNAKFVSPVLRSTARNSRNEYIDRVLNPAQRAVSATERDIAGLRAIKERAQLDGSFEPEKMNCDLGIISRLSSLSLIAYDEQTDRFVLTDRENSTASVQGWWQRTFGA